MAVKYWIGTDTGNEGDYSTAANWSPSGVPIASDTVIIPAQSSQNITAGLDQSAINVVTFIVQEGYTGTIGTSAGYLILWADKISYAGAGVSYISTGSNYAADIDVTKTATATTGAQGLYLIGAVIDDLSIKSGTVGLAVLPNEGMGVANDVRISGGKLTLGQQTYITNLEVNGGAVTIDGTAVTTKIYDGKATTRGTGTAATIISFGGTIDCGGTANITTIHMLGGTVNTTKSGITRTVGAIYMGPGSFIFDPAVISILTTTNIAPASTTNYQPITLKGSV